MSTKETVVSTDPTPIETRFSHAADAKARRQELRDMRARIPHFVIPQKGETQRLGSVAAVPPEFIELTTVAAVDNEKDLTRANGRSADEMRDLMSYAASYAPLADDLEAMAQFVRHSVIAARNEVGHEALLTYSVAQRLAKRPGGAHLVPYVADMRRALGKARKLTAEAIARREARKAAKTPAPPAPETPQES